MSDQEENTERSIVEVPSSALLIREEREKSPILSEMVSAALVVAAETGLANLSAEELVRIGKTFYLKDGPGATEANIKAFSFFYRAAEKGSAEAEWLIYTCIRDGNGVSFDYNISIEWLKKASESGSTEAQYRYVYYLLLGESAPPDSIMGFEQLNMAASLGNSDAQNLLGVIYTTSFEKEWSEDCIRLVFTNVYSNNRVKVDYSQNEIDYFKVRASSENVDAMVFLGRLYLLKIAEESNPLCTHYYIWKKAADLGSHIACWWLGRMHLNPEGQYDTYDSADGDTRNKAPRYFQWVGRGLKGGTSSWSFPALR